LLLLAILACCEMDVLIDQRVSPPLYLVDPIHNAQPVEHAKAV